MDTFILGVHNILRWLVLIFGVIVVVRSFIGWFGKNEWTDLDDKLGLGYTASIDVQFLLGLLLFFVFSDITTNAFSNMSQAMSNPEIRFFLVEHSLMMLVAIILAHIGRSRAKKAATSISKFKNAAIFYSISLLIILVSIPWPPDRPWFRLPF